MDDCSVYWGRVPFILLFIWTLFTQSFSSWCPRGYFPFSEVRLSVAVGGGGGGGHNMFVSAVRASASVPADEFDNNERRDFCRFLSDAPAFPCEQRRIMGFLDLYEGRLCHIHISLVMYARSASQLQL